MGDGWLGVVFTVWFCFFPSLFVFYVLFILPSVIVFFSQSLFEYFDCINYKDSSSLFFIFLRHKSLCMSIYIFPK